MQMYASTAGKSGGEFYTPQEVSELLARITVVGKTEVNKVYDPACGSGSLLLKFAKVLGQDNVRQGFFGQEINLTTYNLCRINMFLHDVNYEKFDIAHGDTLIDPQHWDDEPFEAIVSNPPYSIKWEGDANPLLINDPRFAPAGVLAPKSKADLAFTMHILSWLAVNGTAAIVEFPGVLYRGGAEQKIRKYLDRQQLRRHRHPAPAGPVLRHDDRDLHHRAEEVARPTTRSLFIDASAEFVRGRQQEQAHRGEPAEDPRRVHAHATTSTTSPSSSTTARSPRTATTSPSAPTSRPRTPARPSTSAALNAEIARIVARQAELRTADRRDRRRPRGERREPDRRPHRRAVPERCRVQAAGRGRDVHPRRRLHQGRHQPRMESACIHYGEIYTRLRSLGDDGAYSRPIRAGAVASRCAKRATSSSLPSARRSKTCARPSPGSVEDEVAIHDDCLRLSASARPDVRRVLLADRAPSMPKRRSTSRAPR